MDWAPCAPHRAARLAMTKRDPLTLPSPPTLTPSLSRQAGEGHGVGFKGERGIKVDLSDEAFDWNQALCHRIYGEEETF